MLISGIDCYLPVPVRFEVCGLLLALSLTLNLPVRVPVCFGVKVTSIEHLSLAPKLVVQVVDDTAKSPVVEIVMALSGTFWLLASVKVLGLLVVPTVWVP